MARDFKPVRSVEERGVGMSTWSAVVLVAALGHLKRGEGKPACLFPQLVQVRLVSNMASLKSATATEEKRRVEGCCLRRDFEKWEEEGRRIEERRTRVRREVVEIIKVREERRKNSCL